MSKLEQMAEEYADKFNNFGGTYHGDVIRHIRIEAFKEALSIPEAKAMREALEFYANRMNWTMDDYRGVSGEMSRFVIIKGDVEDVNEFTSFAGVKARKALQLAEEKVR